ncbi:uncharacterized protein LOC134176262 [Corticium candelabrum]|uniref:uncharacterized protein LOC134176262 n=1 Tax=Corticium candelabrum TaxID=121492 RepID=UPI002E25C1EB|nr:uncharacterized protein LOC134176262 [Corticium candelabrum]
MSYAFDGVFLYLLGFISLFAGSASSLPIEVRAARDLKKDVDLNLTCSKQLCFTSCGVSGLEDVQLRTTGLPLLIKSKTMTVDFSFVANEVITTLVFTINGSVSIPRLPNVTPISLFSFFDQCDFESSEFQCPWIAGKRVHFKRILNVDNLWDAVLQEGMQVSAVVTMSDQNQQLLCLKGEAMTQ